MDSAIANRIMATLASIEYLSSTPDLSMKLLSKVKDKNSSVDDIAAIILPNMSLSASILRLANSVFYSRGAHITTISHAVVHLGLDAVVNYVFAMEIMNNFHTGQDKSGFESSLFWKSSLAGALLAQELGALAGVNDVESVFVAGLLRDMGIVVLRQYFMDIFKDVCDGVYKGKMGFAASCKNACGLDHQAIAFLLGKRWNLPDKILSVFATPTPGSHNYDENVRNRNIVLFSDYILKVKNVFQWDSFGAPNPGVAANMYIPADVTDAALSRIVSEVNEFFNSI